MTDLFGGDARNTCGEARENRSAHLGDPIVHVRNRGTAGSRGRTAETCVPHMNHRATKGPARVSADYLESLAESRRRLRADINELDQGLYELQPSYDALKAAFYAAHEALAWEWGNQSDFSADAKAKRRPLYDARMQAGTAWHPIRARYQELQRARDAMAKELRLINMELGE